MGVESLPPELLVHIFAICFDDEPTAAAVLDQVNTFWRAVLAATPALFQSIVLACPHRSQSSLQAQAKTFLLRSAPLPFDVHIVADTLAVILPLLVPFFAPDVLPRWRRVTVEWEGETRSHTFNPSARRASMCEIELRDPYELQLDVAGGAGPGAGADVSSATRRARVRDCLPLFHAFPRGDDVSLGAALHALPSVPALGGTLPFTRLDLTEGASASAAHPRALLAFLRACPRLTVLRWQAWAREFEDMQGLPPVGGVSLPALHTLEIANTLCARRVLRTLHVPALRALHLANLNVHALLPPALERADSPEPGDSDDDAGDFSQSPSSDIATGMALRSLLACSKPSLRTLEMDYVDMRTKDFRWCFDRLPDLRAFRIVGSDMSNTVVDFLRPEAPSITQEDDMSDADSDEEPDTQCDSPRPYHVRLPALARLEITGALRLTGEALVSALRARELYARADAAFGAGSPASDTGAEYNFGMGSEASSSEGAGGCNTGTASCGGVAVLEHIKVSRCPGVSAEDDEALGALFGRRFTTA